MEQWLKDDVALPGIDGLEVQHFYRAMDVLAESQAEVQREVYHSVADLLNLEVDLLFLDTTSTYFEVNCEDQADGEDEDYYLRRRGYSKDHRPDLAQVVIGLAVTRQGIPIRCWVWPGNTVDVNVIPEVKKDLMECEFSASVLAWAGRELINASGDKEVSRYANQDHARGP